MSQLSFQLRRIEQRLTSVSQRTSWRAAAAVGTALLAFGGAAAGTYISFRFEEQKWRRTTTYDAARALYGKRMELIERTTRAFNQADSAAILDTYVAAQRKEAATAETSLRADILRSVLEADLKRQDLTNEYATTLTLNAVYFGPKTRKAVVPAMVQGEWWRVTPEKQHALLQAMYDELAYDPSR